MLSLDGVLSHGVRDSEILHGKDRNTESKK